MNCGCGRGCGCQNQNESYLLLRTFLIRTFSAAPARVPLFCKLETLKLFIKNNLFLFFFQGAADFHLQGSRVPHRPEDEAVVAGGLLLGRQRLLLLRLIQSFVQNHLGRGNKGKRTPKSD